MLWRNSITCLRAVNRRLLFFTAGFASLLVFATAVPGQLQPPTSQSTAPTVIDLSGKAVDPIRESRGRVTVLLFVRTDCPISNRYAPELRRLIAEFPGKANFWLVYPDAKESPERIAEHLKQFDLRLPAVRDIHHRLVEKSHATVTPEAAVFDASGDLRYYGRIDNWYEDFGRSRPKPTTHDLQDAIRATSEGRMTASAYAPAVGCYIADVK
jgi:hypothetical protein